MEKAISADFTLGHLKYLCGGAQNMFHIGTNATLSRKTQRPAHRDVLISAE